MYIDVLGMSSVSEAVQEASRMLRIGIAQAMSKGILDDSTTTENQDRQKSQIDAPQAKPSQPSEKDPVSVYSSVTKRTRRQIPVATEPVSLEQSPQQSEHPTSAANRGGFAPRSWSASKKAGPSILSKRNRSAIGNGNATSGSGSVFQPGPKREKPVDNKDGKKDTVSRPAESTKPAGDGNKTKEGPIRQLSSSPSTKDETKRPRSGAMAEKSTSDVPTTLPKTSNTPASTLPILKSVQVPSATKENPPSHKDVAKPQQTVTSPGARKVGLPPSWCKVSAKSFKNDNATQSKSTLSLLRKPGPSKRRTLPAAPGGSTALPAISSVKQAGNSSLFPLKSGKLRTDNTGLIPLPSSTGIKVKYVPGSEIIDGVRPNGYTVSIDGVVKPVVTFNPKPKLPHKLRQTSVEKLFEAWRDNKGIAEGDALARALRAEQEMYAKASSRADYRAAVTVKLKEIRKVES